MSDPNKDLNKAASTVRQGLRKVHGGTPNHSAPMLCGTCEHAQTIRGLRSSEFNVHCDWFQKWIPWPVYQCSQYADKRLPSLRDMKDTAWILLSDERRGREVGFISAAEWKRRKEREEEPSDE